MRPRFAPAPWITSVELLEARVAPAGIVAFDYDALTGALTLTGDSSSNQISIFPSGPGTHRVQGDSATTFTGGATFLDIGKLTNLTLAGNAGFDRLGLFELTSLKSLAFEGGSDADVLTLTDVRLQGSIDFSGGTGEDRLVLEGAFCAIARDIQMTGSGELRLEMAAEKIAIGGSLFFTAGAGEYSIGGTSATHVSIAKGMRIESGAAGGSMVLAPLGTLKMGKLPTGESLWLSAGASDDLLIFGSGTVAFAGGIRWEGGAGADTLQFQSGSKSVRIGKLPSGHSIHLTSATNTSTVDVDASPFSALGGIEISGSAAGRIFVDAPHGRISVGKLPNGQSLRVEGGAGNDTISIATSSLTLSGGIELMGAGGTNTLEFVAPHAPARIGKLSNGASILFEGGTGNDTLSLQAGNLVLAGGVDFSGGSGTNVVEFLGSGARVKIGKFAEGESIRFTGGSGPDSLRADVANFATLGGLSFTAGSGVNTLRFDGASGVVAIGKLNTGHSILFTGGSGDDTLQSDQATTVLAGGIELNTGDGNNTLQMQFTGIARIGTLPSGESVRMIGGLNNDGVRIAGALIALKGGIVLNGNAGQDHIDLRSPATTIGKTLEGMSILLDGQDGPDFINLGDRMSLAGSFVLLGGTGNDSLNAVEMRSLIVRGEVLFEGGGDDNKLQFYIDRLEVAKTLIFTAGGGADSAVINANGFIAGAVRLDLGGNLDATQDVTIESRQNRIKGLAFRGGLEIEMSGLNGETLTILNTVVARDFSAVLGPDVSTVTIDNFAGGGAFLLNTGGGADVVLFERGDFAGGSSIAKLATILTGAANDSVLIGSSATSAAGIFPDPTRARFLGGLTLDGGSGTDARNDFPGENDFPGGAPAGLETFEITIM